MRNPRPEVGEKVVTTGDANASSKAQAIFTQLHDQDAYLGEQVEDLESNDYLKPSTPPKCAGVERGLDIFNKPTQILVTQHQILVRVILHLS